MLCFWVGGWVVGLGWYSAAAGGRIMFAQRVTVGNLSLSRVTPPIQINSRTLQFQLRFCLEWCVRVRVSGCEWMVSCVCFASSFIHIEHHNDMSKYLLCIQSFIYGRGCDTYARNAPSYIMMT